MINYLSHYTDYTDQTNKELADMRNLLDSSLDVICSFDHEGRFLYASKAAKRMWGYEPEEIIGTLYMDLVHPDDHPKTIAAAEAIISGINVTNFDNRYLKKDGTLIPIVWSATWDMDKQVMNCIAKDATEKKQLEQSLNKSRLMFESFMNNAPFVA